MGGPQSRQQMGRHFYRLGDGGEHLGEVSKSILMGRRCVRRACGSSICQRRLVELPCVCYRCRYPPMSFPAEEMLVEQAAMIKAFNPLARVFVYRCVR